jgi:hypothetical protein
MEEREPGLLPLDDEATGCTLVFTPAGRMYQPMSALAVLAGLFARNFTGVCECYLRPGVHEGEYLMGVGLGFPDGPEEDGWWGAFVSNVRDACEDDEDVHLDRDACEFSAVGELRAAMVHAGTAGFESGLVVWVSEPAEGGPGSPFTSLCRSTRPPKRGYE